MTEKPKRYRVTAEITISIHVAVLASNKRDAMKLAEECSLPTIHEDTLYEQLDNPDYEPEWRTSGELDGTPVRLTAELEEE